MRCDTQADPCSIQQLERHVRFSGKDDIIGSRKKDFFTSEWSTGDVLSDGFAASSEKIHYIDDKVSPMEVNGSDDDVSISMDYGTQIDTVSGRKEPDISDHVNLPNSLRPHISNQGKVKHLPKKTVFQSQGTIHNKNFHPFNQGCPIASHKPAFTGIPGLLSELEGPFVNTQVGSNVSRVFNSRGKLVNHVLDPIQRVSEITSLANTKALPEPSSCFASSENANWRLQLQSRPAVEKFNDHTLRYQPYRRLSPMDFMGTMSPFPEVKQNAVAWREKCMDENFFGLPLNSQGELIQSSSRGKGAANQLRETNSVTWSSSSLPACNLTQPRSTGDYLSVNNKHFVVRELPNDHLNLFPVQNYVKEKPSLHIPARLGVTYLESTGRADMNHLDFVRGSNRTFQPFDPDLNLMNMSFNGSTQYNLVQNQEPSGATHPKETPTEMSPNTSQPTMRLMGKDVAIGKSSVEMQGYEDEKVWTDKEIITERCHSEGTILDSSSLNRNFHRDWIPQIVSGKSKETIAPSPELDFGLAPQSDFPRTAPGSSSFAYLNWQSNNASSYPSGSLAANRYPSSYMLPSYADLPTSHKMFNRAANFQELFISGPESLRLGNSHLPALNTCHEHVHWRPSEQPHYKQNPLHFTKPGLDFPFLDPDSRDVDVHSSWFHQGCTKSLPSWLLHATQQQGKAPTSQSFSSTGGSKNHQHISCGTSILNNPSVYHSASDQVGYSCNPVTSHNSVQVKTNGTTHGPQATSIVFPPLVPVIPGVKPTSSAINVAYRNRMKVKDRLKSKALGIKDLYPCKKSKKRPVDNESSKVAGMNVTRSGPIRLSGGAKHILKPTRNIDHHHHHRQDDSRPILFQ
ncbi:hypothetical protein FNV43_RR14647 [Rhamnella rubrinervis]|uniref:Uncharacterized protein n=1 Tax=Rhamnella rubrinervis TaxID=2594499 RepID=A0A8K0H3H5_9ROSA|nr:hypothetical protein FNV43_RR14647 [Rhamnella rubrinervis]